MDIILKQKEEQLNSIAKLVNMSIASLKEKITETNNNFEEYKKREKESYTEDFIFNKLIDNIKSKAYLTRINKYNNNVREYEIYLKRCNAYFNYLKVKATNNALNEVGYRYTLVNTIQEEIIIKIKNELEHKYDRIDLDDACLSAINEVAKMNEINKGEEIQKPDEVVPDFIRNLTMNKDEKLESIEFVIDASLKLDEYKKMFKEVMFKIPDDLIKSDMFFNYNVKSLVDLLYVKEEVKNEVQIK